MMDHSLMSFMKSKFFTISHFLCSSRKRDYVLSTPQNLRLAHREKIFSYEKQFVIELTYILEEGFAKAREIRSITIPFLERKLFSLFQMSSFIIFVVTGHKTLLFSATVHSKESI